MLSRLKLHKKKINRLMSIWYGMMVALCYRVKGIGCRETILLETGYYLKALVFVFNVCSSVLTALLIRADYNK